MSSHDNPESGLKSGPVRRTYPPQGMALSMQSKYKALASQPTTLAQGRLGSFRIKVRPTSASRVKMMLGPPHRGGAGLNQSWFWHHAQFETTNAEQYLGQTRPL